MREITDSHEELIDNLQKIILKNTSTLDEQIRSRVYSRFQKVRYFMLNSDDELLKGVSSTAVSFFSHADGNVYIVDNGLRIKQNALLHEMIHSVTFEKGQDIIKQNGLVSREEYFSKRKNVKMEYRSNVALNEGATEFYTQTFLNVTTNYYMFYVNIYKILSEVCGYENLMNAYFSCDINKFKKTVSNAFHLSNNYMIEKLMEQMNVVYNINENHSITDAMPILKSCYETLALMQVYKLKFEARKIANNKEEFIAVFNKKFKDFNIADFIMKDCTYLQAMWLKEITKQLTEQKNNLLGKFRTKKCESDITKKDAAELVDCMAQQDFKPIAYYRDNSGSNKLDVLRQLNQRVKYSYNGYNCNNKKVIKNFLIAMHDEKGKINFNGFAKREKYEFINLIMFNEYEDIRKCYNHFYLNDLKDYLNNEYDAYHAFLNVDAVKYIMPIIPSLNDEIKKNKDFASIYSSIINSKEEISKEL